MVARISMNPSSFNLLIRFATSGLKDISNETSLKIFILSSVNSSFEIPFILYRSIKYCE